MSSHGSPFVARTCGLVIHADAPISGLRPLGVPASPDVVIRMRGSITTSSLHVAGSEWYVSPYRDHRDVPLLTIHRVESSYLLCYAEGTRFLVSALGKDVDAWWEAPLSEADVADYLLGGVLAFIVRLRGMVPLHASAVAVQDCAVLFAGDAGAGKSSVAAACAILGHPVLSDDIVVMDDSSDAISAYPSHARLSLWPDSARSLLSTTALPPHSPVYDKRRLDLIDHGYRFHERALPLGMICVLGSRTTSCDGPVIRELRPHDALMTLVRHTYGNYLLDAPMRAREFDVLGRVVTSVPVLELSLASRLDQLVPDCQRLVERLALQSATQAT